MNIWKWGISKVFLLMLLKGNFFNLPSFFSIFSIIFIIFIFYCSIISLFWKNNKILIIVKYIKIRSIFPKIKLKISRFTKQLLIALQFLSKNHIIHCDLKPENILLNKPNGLDITVIDFGSSCFENEASMLFL